jgi:hypothetical protein
MSTQLISFSIGGVACLFLVAPPAMIWPANLVNCSLFNTLHSTQYAGMGSRGDICCERFFVHGFLASFVWCKSTSFQIPPVFIDPSRPQISSWDTSVRHPLTFFTVMLNPVSSPSPLVLSMGHLDQTPRPQSVFLAFCIGQVLTLTIEIAALFGSVYIFFFLPTLN